jgi:hypothetical protein
MSSGAPRINSNLPAGALPILTPAQLRVKDTRYNVLKAGLPPAIVQAIDTTILIYTELGMVDMPGIDKFMNHFKKLTDSIIEKDASLSPDIKRELRAYNFLYFYSYASGIAKAEVSRVTFGPQIMEVLYLAQGAYKDLGGNPEDFKELIAMAREWMERTSRNKSAALMSRMPAPGSGAIMVAEPAAGPGRGSILPPGVRWNARNTKGLTATQVAVAAMVNAHKNKFKPTAAEARAQAKEFERLQQKHELEELKKKHAAMAKGSSGAPRKGGSRCVKKAYSLNTRKVARSPFRSINTAKKALKRYTRKQPIGFTATSSLKSMGIIPRASGCYELGAKYE